MLQKCAPGTLVLYLILNNLFYISLPPIPAPKHNIINNKKNQYFVCLKNTSSPSRHLCKNKSLRVDFDLTNTSINEVSLLWLQQIYS